MSTTLQDTPPGSADREEAAGEVRNSVVTIAFRQHLRRLVNLLLRSRVIATNEGLDAQFDPDLRLMVFAAPSFHRFWLQRLVQGLLGLTS
ncbi:MAG: hypothetical protein M5U01_37560 [Ardenticatenaceae bacterium]|nr:hypothetical protein [Ardenticatenaceae bacterium]